MTSSWPGLPQGRVRRVQHRGVEPGAQRSADQHADRPSRPVASAEAVRESAKSSSGGSRPHPLTGAGRDPRGVAQGARDGRGRNTGQGGDVIHGGGRRVGGHTLMRAPGSPDSCKRLRSCRCEQNHIQRPAIGWSGRAPPPYACASAGTIGCEPSDTFSEGPDRDRSDRPLHRLDDRRHLVAPGRRLPGLSAQLRRQRRRRAG